MATLTRRELTAALAARQLLLERRTMAPAAAIRLLTPLQAQHPTAPHIALAARLEGFSREDLHEAITARAVVKTTTNRMTLHLVAAEDYPSYAEVARRPHLRRWRTTYPHLDEEQVVAELGAWLREPRTNPEIRRHVQRYPGVDGEPSTAVFFARTLLPLVQLPPAGFWDDPQRSRFVADPRPRPPLAEAAALVLSRYLAAYGPAGRRDVAAWAGVPQRDLAPGWERLRTVSHRDEHGAELLDLPDAPLPPASTPLPVRLFGRWEQPLLAYADRERIIPAEVAPLRLTLSGDQTVTVDGRVAASWALSTHRDRVRVTVAPHVALRRGARSEIREEARRTARFCRPDARAAEVVFT